MDLIVIDVVCLNCRKEFVTVDKTQKKCTKCQQLHRAEVVRKWLGRKVKKPKEEKPAPFTNFVGGGE